MPMEGSSAERLRVFVSKTLVVFCRLHLASPKYHPSVIGNYELVLSRSRHAKIGTLQYI